MRAKGFSARRNVSVLPLLHHTARDESALSSDTLQYIRIPSKNGELKFAVVEARNLKSIINMGTKRLSGKFDKESLLGQNKFKSTLLFDLQLKNVMR